MSMRDFEKACELIDGMDDADFHGPQPEELIALAEQTLQIRFPPTYRAFLSRFGCGDVGGAEFYGLIHDDFENSSVPDAIWATLRQRKQSNLPATLIIVAATGDGGYYAINLSRNTTHGESPVVEWWTGMDATGDNCKTVATDFGAFFLKLVSESQDDDDDDDDDDEDEE